MTKEQWLTPSQALARMTQPAPLTDGARTRATATRFGYRVGTMQFLVGVGVLSELLSEPVVYPIPNTPAALRGYVNRQGTLVPIWDLHALIGQDAELDACFEVIHGEAVRGATMAASIPTSISGAQRESVLVLGRGDLSVGLTIDGLPQSLKKMERAARVPQVPDAFNGYVNEAWFADNALWFEFDHEGFFRVQTERAAA